jgi:hypothetical protein
MGTPEGEVMSKTALSFYLDDTSPYGRPPDTFERFLDFVDTAGIAGESSVILGSGWQEFGLLSRPSTETQRRYIEQLQRAFGCGIDAHMELMTHAGLYDFTARRVPEGAQHEGVWLHEPEVPVAAYEAYFRCILDEGEKIGVQFTGVTWPGCSCEPCTRRYAELRQSPSFGINPNVWAALLNLAKAGRFRGRTVPCFTNGNRGCRLMAGDGTYGVYDFSPNARDQFGIWENSPEHVDADYYITADGEAGCVVELVRAGAPYCLFYAHWQGLNPATGVGWKPFTQVVKRVQQFLGDRVEWMRPSAYTDRVHDSAAPPLRR